MNRQNPLENDIVISIILKSLWNVDDLKSIRLLNKQWFNASLSKWRKIAGLNVFSFKPRRSPKRIDGKMAGCYEAILAPPTEVLRCIGKHYPMPTLHIEKPFVNYRLQNVTEANFPPRKGTCSNMNEVRFWHTYGSHMMSLRINPIKAMDYDFTEGLMETLFMYCPNLEEIQIGPRNQYSFINDDDVDSSSDDDDWNGNNGIREIVVSDYASESDTDFELPEMPEGYGLPGYVAGGGGGGGGGGGAKQTITLQKLKSLTLHHMKLPNSIGGLFRNITCMAELLSLMPNLKNLTFDTKNRYEKAKLLRALKVAVDNGGVSQPIKLETLKFENGSENVDGNTQGLLLEYLDEARPPLKEYKDFLYMPDNYGRFHTIFKLMEDTIEKLDITLRCGKSLNPAEDLPTASMILPILSGGDRVYNFDKLTNLNLTINYVTGLNLAVFDFQAFHSMLNLQVFCCNWNWNPQATDKPDISSEHFYRKWRLAIGRCKAFERTSLKGGPLKLDFMKEFHLNVKLDIGILNILRSWMGNLKILETILEEKDVGVPQQLWPGLETFKNLPESSVTKEKRYVYVDRLEITEEKISEVHVGWWEVK